MHNFKLSFLLIPALICCILSKRLPSPRPPPPPLNPRPPPPISRPLPPPSRPIPPPSRPIPPPYYGNCGLIWIRPPPEQWRPPIYHPIPLLSVHVTASVTHAVAQVEVTQVYINREDKPIEAVYYFPMNPDGAVISFRAELDGRVIKGVVKPNEEAKEAYNKAIANKQTAFLGEETKPDIFKIRVGYLKPGTQVKVIIGYVTEVKNEPGTNNIRFYIPTTIAPRYVSPSETDPKSKDIKNMKFSNTFTAPLTMKVGVSLQGGIKSVESPTHKVKIDGLGPDPRRSEWHKANVELEGMTTVMDRDFVLNIVPSEVHKPRLYSEKNDQGRTAVMIHFVPSFKLQDQKTELLFVLDRSGSMMGQSIDLARKALLMFIHSMPADCYFNIIGFGSTFQFLFPESVRYNDHSLKKAIEHAQGVQADLGGTEVFQPLQAIYNKPGVKGYLRQIFLLTDGEVSDTDRVLGIIQANAHRARVFALGIGDGASHYLVEGAAKAGGGTSAFVTYNESIDKKVLNQLKNGMQPSLTEIELEWEGIRSRRATTPQSGRRPDTRPVSKEKSLMGYNKPIEPDSGPGDQPIYRPAPPPFDPQIKQSPKKIPPVYDGSQMLVFGLFRSSPPNSVTIKAKSPDGPLTLKVAYSSANDAGNLGMLHRLAAVKLIREMELEVSSWKYLSSRNEENPMEKRLKQEIIDISVQNGVTSRYTSYIAVDEKDNKPSDESWIMETREVPSTTAHGWHGGMGGGGGRPMYLKGGPVRGSSMRLAAGEEMQSDGMENASSRKHSSPPRPPPPPRAPPPPSSEHMQLIQTQKFDGSFPISETLARIVGKSVSQLTKGATKLGMKENVFATALAVNVFQTKFSSEKDTWELVVLKAKKWLSKEVGGGQVETTIQRTSTYL